MSKPHFIIAGERRSGSTTLYEILKNHPEIEMIPERDYDFFIEPELFSKSFIEDETWNEWDRTHSIADYFKKFDGLKGITGQKDADLLWWKPSHTRLATYLPDTKFIVILRDPVMRAESQYYNELSKGRESSTIIEALLREDDDQNSWEKLHLQYKYRGCYIDSLDHFFKYVSKGHVHIIILEELIQEWDRVMTDLCDFLEIDKHMGLTLNKVHSNKEKGKVRSSFSKSKGIKWLFDLYDRFAEAVIRRISKKKDSRDKWRNILKGFYYISKRPKKKIEGDLKEKLELFYSPYNKRLEDLLGYKINHW